MIYFSILTSSTAMLESCWSVRNYRSLAPCESTMRRGHCWQVGSAPSKNPKPEPGGEGRLQQLLAALTDNQDDKLLTCSGFCCKRAQDTRTQRSFSSVSSLGDRQALVGLQKPRPTTVVFRHTCISSKHPRYPPRTTPAHHYTMRWSHPSTTGALQQQTLRVHLQSAWDAGTVSAR